MFLTDELRSVLKATVVPRLRSRGFRGSFPHLWRDRVTHLDVISFSFASPGSGRLFVDVGVVPTEGRVYGGHAAVPAKLVTAARADGSWRLGATRQAGQYHDHWFTYAKFIGEADDWIPAVDPATICQQVAELLEEAAFPWWNGTIPGPLGLTSEVTLRRALEQNALNREWNSNHRGSADA